MAPGAYTNMTSLISLNENPDLEPDLTLTTQTVAYLEVPVHEAQRLKSGTSGYASVVLEPSCCKKRKKKIPNQENGLGNRGTPEGAELILNG